MWTQEAHSLGQFYSSHCPVQLSKAYKAGTHVVYAQSVKKVREESSSKQWLGGISK